MMGHPSDECDGDGVSMDATLLVSGNSSSSGKYGRIWRRYLFVFRISLSIRRISRQSRFAIGIDSDSEDEQSKAEEQLCSPEDILRIVKERDIVSLRAIGGVEKAISILASTGVSPSKLLPHQRLALQSRALLCRLVTACSSLTILLLLICAGLSFAVEIMEQGPQHGWHDGVAILVTVFLLVIFRCFSKFRSKKNESKFQVMRNGELLSVPISRLLRGDVMVLSEGDVVPADGLLVYGDTLDLDDKSKIDCYENPFLLCGSEVIRGHGRMLVTSEGEGARTASDEPEHITLLAARVHKPNSYIEIIGLAVSVVLAFVILVGLICRGPRKNDDILPELKGSLSVDGLFKIFENTFFRPRSRLHVLTGSLAAFLIAMQHGMPFAITVSLSFWNWKVEYGGAEPRNLTACGTMGLVTVICVNATGGLMCDQMEVEEFFVGREDMCLTVDPKFDKVFLEALCLGIHLPETSICPANDVAVTDWVKSKFGSDMELSDECYSVVDYGRSRSSSHCSRVVTKENRNGGTMHMYLRGDASTIINLCSHYYDRTGQIHSIEDGEGIHFQELIENMKSKGLITLAFACKQVETAQSNEEDSYLLAVVGLKSAFREVIEGFRNARVHVILVSQDELVAVRQIAHELQVFPNYPELDCEQVRHLSFPERAERIQESAVIGGCQAEDMLLAIQRLKEKGHVVAYFGGLTTREAMALKEADIGITKQNKSTRKAMERSDIIISDVHSLPRVTKLGQCAYNNIQKFTQLQLTACFSGLLINLISAIWAWDSPLTPIQLIYMNFTKCLTGGLMMVTEHTSDTLIPNSAIDRTDPLINKARWKSIAMQVLSQSLVSVMLHIIHGTDEETWKVMVFNSFMLCQLIFNEVNLRIIWKGKRVFLVGLVIVVMVQVVVVEIRKSLSGFKRLNLEGWLFSLIIAAASYGVGTALTKISMENLSKWIHQLGLLMHIILGF